jgi:ubiquinol-cytochrome c reductase cytochrome c1 subunit
MRKFLILAATVLLLAGVAKTAFAAEGEDENSPEPAKEPNHYSWSFEGPFGTYDRAALQRGFQVYKEVCSACHSLKYVTYGDLEAIGFTEAEVKALAAQVQYTDGPNDKGEMFDRPGVPSDHLKSPFPNEQAAAATYGKAPPDLSLMTDARPQGPSYIRSLLTGFINPPAGIKVPDGKYYDPYFGSTRGHPILMPPPLTDDRVTYADGTKATTDQEAADVVTFLSWAADPSLEARHNLGFKVVAFLIVLVGMFYAVKRKVWAGVH